MDANSEECPCLQFGRRGRSAVTRLRYWFFGIKSTCGLAIALCSCIHVMGQDVREAGSRIETRSIYEEVLIVAKESVSLQTLDRVVRWRTDKCGGRVCRIVLVDNVKMLQDDSTRIYDLSVDTKIWQLKKVVDNSGPIAEWIEIPGVLRVKRVRTEEGAILKDVNVVDPQLSRMFSVASVAAVDSDRGNGGVSVLLSVNSGISNRRAEMILDEALQSPGLHSAEITVRIRHDMAFLDDESVVTYGPFVEEQLPTPGEYVKRREIVCRRRKGETFSCVVQ